MGKRAETPRKVRVLVPGTGRAVEVFAVPSGVALEAALRETRGLAGRVIRRGGSWVFLTAAPRAAPQVGRLFLGRELLDALEEQYPGWLGGLEGVAVRPSASGAWVESGEAAQLARVRSCAAGAR